jgi:16S rRNA (cytidine1402-2'-O)-methyltransferase
MLYLIATPIGNLGDISLRALDVLRAVDWVISEDTRKTGHMLRHFDISKPQLSFFEGNESRQLPRIMSLLQEGRELALVSNAGTPVISDPGYTLVRVALDAEIPLTAIPGPTAFVTALVLSGLPAHSFTFRGFPPRKPGARRRFLEVDRESPHTLIYYESPHRLAAFLSDALQVFGNRPAAIANDLTKKFEQVNRGPLSELIENVSSQTLRGEYSVVIAGMASDRNKMD